MLPPGASRFADEGVSGIQFEGLLDSRLKQPSETYGELRAWNDYAVTQIEIRFSPTHYAQ